ncbi:MAG TPA: hypothetical protein VHI73_02120 [Solirubrobacteraceae bacterium]|jgi:hypothetical protein|nr:hypothetical protein [Solirubrobacteraceae bacterium]
MNPPPVVYVDPPDVPVGMTLAEYRRRGSRSTRRGLRRRAGRLLRSAARRRRVG